MQAVVTQLQQAQQEQATVIKHGLAAQIAKLPEKLAEAMRGTRGQSLIDSRGLGKPFVFDNVEEHFVHWARKTQNYIKSVYRDCREALSLAVESTVETSAAVIDVEATSGMDRDALDRRHRFAHRPHGTHRERRLRDRRRRR